MLATEAAKRKKELGNDEKQAYIDRKVKNIAFAVGGTCIFCFGQVVKDLPLIPVFLLGAVLGPWRLAPLFKTAYRYTEAKKVSYECDAGREELLKRFGLVLKDWRCVLELIILVLIPFRLPFLYVILKKNVFRDRYPAPPTLDKRSSSIIEDDGKSKVQAGQPPQPPARMNFHKCVHVTFKEFCKDLKYSPFAVLAVVIAPWRIVTLYQILKAQTERVPSRDNFKTIYSRREEVLTLFFTVLTTDVPCALITLALVLTVYRIPNVLRIYKSGMFIAWSRTEKVVDRIWYRLT